MKIHTVLVLVSSIFFSCASARAVDLKEFERKLTSEGVEVEIHGADVEHGMYVITYRGKSFFDYVEMSMITERDDVIQQMKLLNRHDRIRIKGTIAENPSPQKHVSVSSFEVVKKYDSKMETRPYEYEARIPDELLDLSEANFLVHAIHGEGKVLVVEYKDAVLPVFVRNGELTKNLSRNDLVKLKFVVRNVPNRPVHLSLNTQAPQPVEVIESVMALHEKPADVEGALVLFPKSPQVLFNVFAVLHELPNGLKRQYTLINFDDSKEFEKIREKLQKAWDMHKNDFVNGRNKFVSTKVRIRAKGTFNQVDPNQANVQILLKSADSIEITQ